LFFASTNDMIGQFDYAGDPDRVVVDLSGAHVWDASSVAVLDAVEQKYSARGKSVQIAGLTDVTGHYHQRLAGRLGGAH
jgi:SulP family sulfate permease